MSESYYSQRIYQNTREISALEELTNRQEQTRIAYSNYTKGLETYHAFLKTGNVNIATLTEKIKMSTHYIKIMQDQLGIKLINKQFAASDVGVAMNTEIKKNYEKIAKLKQDITYCNKEIKKINENKD